MAGENNKVIIVTGGSSGIGRCTASALKENGCIVYELSRRSIPSVPPFKFMVNKKRAAFSGHSLMESMVFYSYFAASFSVILQTPFSSVGCLPPFSWYVP